MKKYTNHLQQFSLLNVTSENKDRVSGSWIQDHYGTLKSAQERAREVEAANSNLITVCIVSPVSGVNPTLEFYTDLKKLG